MVSGDNDYAHGDVSTVMESEDIKNEIVNAIDSFKIESDEYCNYPSLGIKFLSNL